MKRPARRPKDGARLNENVEIRVMIAAALQRPRTLTFHFTWGGFSYLLAGGRIVGSLPDVLPKIALAALILSGAASLTLLLREWCVARKPVCVNGVTGYIAAAYLWVLLPYVSPMYFLFVPLFHSLQYLPFVYWYKLGEIAHEGGEDPGQPLRRRTPARMIAFVLAAVALGAFFMDLAPKHLDSLATGPQALFSQNFFLVSFLLFINIHHYFIDHAFWRRDNAKVQTFLFRRAPPQPPARTPAEPPPG